MINYIIKMLHRLGWIKINYPIQSNKEYNKLMTDEQLNDRLNQLYQLSQNAEGKTPVEILKLYEAYITDIYDEGFTDGMDAEGIYNDLVDIKNN